MTSTENRLQLPFAISGSAGGRSGAAVSGLEAILAAAVAATPGSVAFLRLPEGFPLGRAQLGRSSTGPWEGEMPPIIEDAIERALEDGEIVHVEGERIGAEFGEAEGVESIVAVPLPIPGGPQGAFALQSDQPLEPGAREAVLALASAAVAVLALESRLRRVENDPELGLPGRAALEASLDDLVRTGHPATISIVEPDDASPATLRRLADLLVASAGPGVLVARAAPGRLGILFPSPAETAGAACRPWIGTAAGLSIPIRIGLADGAPHLFRAGEALAQARGEGADPVRLWQASDAGAATDPLTALEGSPLERALAEAAAIGRGAATASDVAREALLFLVRAAGAQDGRIALGASPEELDPAAGLETDRVTEAFERPGAAVLWRKKGSRARNAARATLTLPGAGGPVGAVELDFDLEEVAADSAYRARALAGPLGLAIERAALAEEAARLRERLGPEAQSELLGKGRRSSQRRAISKRAGLKYDYTEIIGECAPMIEVFAMLDKVIDSNVPVLILGESGTGKELIARAIHFKGPRKKMAYVSENCAAVTETLLESELFGYMKGAFTGASQNKRGLFEVADGGTLFLDEVGDMSPGMQKKLLRALQDGEIRPVGGKSVKHVDTRVIAATNRDLARMIREGTFREDLFYRLNVVAVNLPPLRERDGDVRYLIEFFLKKTCKEMGVDKKIDDEAMEYLLAYRWPGNIRELENEVKRLVALSDDKIDKSFLSPTVLEAKKK